MTYTRTYIAVFFGLILLFFTSSLTAQQKLYAVQVAATETDAEANELVAQLKAKQFDAYWIKSTIPNVGVRYRVRIGRFPNRASADQHGNLARQNEIISEYVIVDYIAPTPFQPQQTPKGAPQTQNGSTPKKLSETIVFSSERDGNQEIYSLNLATNALKNLSHHSSQDGYPRCSPDGKTIAFVSNRSGTWKIHLMNSDGTEQRVFSQAADEGYMDWSPDGNSLVYASALGKNGVNDLYVANINDPTKKLQLTNHNAEDVHPTWSPDGKNIAFASERDGNRQIYVMNANGGDLKRITNNQGYEDYPAWSPDSSKIVFASDRDSGSSQNLDIYVMEANGAAVKQLINHTADDRHPAWSPDGKTIAFVSNRNGDRDLFTVNLDGSELRRLFSAPGNDEHPHWKPLPLTVANTVNNNSSKPIRSKPASLITSKTKMPSGYYFTVNMCRACLYSDWADDAINWLRERGVNARYGQGGESLSSELPFAPIRAFQVKLEKSSNDRASDILMQMDLYIGPFTSQTTANKSAQAVSEVLYLIQKKRIFLELASTANDDPWKLNQSDRIQRYSGNNYNYGFLL